MLKGLSQEHEIVLVTTIRNESERQYIEKLHHMCTEVITVSINPETIFELMLKLIKSLFSSTPIVVERHYSYKLADVINKLFRNNGQISRNGECLSSDFDVVHFSHLDASVYINCIPKNVPKVLDQHNIVTNQIKTTAEVEKNLIKQVYMKLQLSKSLLYEADICRKIDRCLVCSDTDKSYLLEMINNDNIGVVPNGVDVKFFSGKSWDDNRVQGMFGVDNWVVFVGTLDYGPCETGVFYFCKEILPKIVEKVADIHFVVVGRNPSRRLQKLARDEKSIVLTGEVQDVRPYVDGARVSVVPLLSGSGTRLKILDAMAMRIPVVSTSIGAEGLNVVHGESILIADSPGEFCGAVLELLEDDIKGKRIVENAWKLVREKYDWERIWRGLLGEYRSLEKERTADQ